jgi:transcriptional regulator with XRE-family HTH domain
MQDEKFHAGMRFELALRHLKWTQREAAEFFGIYQSGISRWQNTEVFPDSVVAKLRKLESVGINTDFFIFKDEKLKLDKDAAKEEIVKLRIRNSELEESVRKLQARLNDCEKKKKGASE